jgi:hypothetical protein
VSGVGEVTPDLLVRRTLTTTTIITVLVLPAALRVVE